MCCKDNTYSGTDKKNQKKNGKTSSRLFPSTKHQLLGYNYRLQALKRVFSTPIQRTHNLLNNFPS